MGVLGTLQEGGVALPLGQGETFLGGLLTDFLSENGYFWARRGTVHLLLPAEAV